MGVQIYPTVVLSYFTKTEPYNLKTVEQIWVLHVTPIVPTLH